MFGPQGPKTLLVWDFDHSLVNANVDTLILDGVPPVDSEEPSLLDQQAELWRRTRPDGSLEEDDAAAGGTADTVPMRDWVDVMNEMLRRLAARVGSAEEKALKKHIRAQLDAQLAKEDDSGSLLHSKVKECNVEAFVRGWDQAIISQANSELIRYVLKKGGLGPMMEGRVFTFPSKFSDDGNELVVQRYHGEGGVRPAHSCANKLSTGKPTCSAMMCKGAILRDDLKAFQSDYEHIVYVGDGLGDVCPCLGLRDSDAVMARSGFALSLELERLPPEAVPARVVDWGTYEELFESIESMQQVWSTQSALDQGLLPEGFVMATGYEAREDED